MAALNRLLEHERFPYLMLIIRRYFNDELAVGIVGRNDMLDLATAALGDFAKTNPDNKSEIATGARFIKSQKLGKHEAELEKIKSVFMSIIKDIKSGIGENQENIPAATAEMMQGIWRQLEDKPRSEITAEDVSDAVVNMVGQASGMDEKSAEMFRALVAGMLKNAADDTDANG